MLQWIVSIWTRGDKAKEEKRSWHTERHQYAEKVSKREAEGTTENWESQSGRAWNYRCSHNPSVPSRCSRRRRLCNKRSTPYFDWLDQWAGPYPGSQCNGSWHWPGLLVGRHWKHFVAKITSSCHHRDPAFSDGNWWSECCQSSASVPNSTRPESAPAGVQFFVTTAVCASAGRTYTRIGRRHQKTPGGESEVSSGWVLPSLVNCIFMHLRSFFNFQGCQVCRGRIKAQVLHTTDQLYPAGVSILSTEIELLCWCLTLSSLHWSAPGLSCSAESTALHCAPSCTHTCRHSCRAAEKLSWSGWRNCLTRTWWGQLFWVEIFTLLSNTHLFIF